MSTLAERLKELRADLGLGQKEFAKLVGVSPGAIGNYESGDRKAPRAIVGIAVKAGVSPEWLSTGKGPKYLTDERVVLDESPADDDANAIPAYIAEIAARLSPEGQNRLMIAAERMQEAERRGDVLRLVYSIEPAEQRVSLPMPSPVPQR